MEAMKKRKCLIFVVAVLSLSLLGGCAHHEKAPADRPGYLYYHKPLPEAARTLDAARAQGKDKECPAEFAAASALVDNAFETYMACRTQEAIAKAQDAITKIRALCPPKPVVEIKPEVKPEPMTEPKPVPAPAPKPAPEPAAPPARADVTLETIHFDFNKATLTKEALEILARNLKILKEHPELKVQIEGHACAHGAEDQNMVLSQRRADAVKEYFERGGIGSDRLTTISYGETRLALPEIPTPKNKDSKEAIMNRRVQFTAIIQ